jgi:hypothetical protein
MTDMTKREQQRLRSIIRKLNEVRAIADSMDLTLDNGGEVGGIIGSVADELEITLERESGAKRP